jgi:uridine phosphorylase
MASYTELILNADGSVYHLNLQPGQIADTVFLVGDPGRVERVSKLFDTVEFAVSKREFITHTGRVGDKRVSVVSTGIGTDNLDIVINELDALINIDLDSRTPKPELQKLNLIRLGTSGCLQKDIPVDTLLCSSYGIGLDNLLHFYRQEETRPDMLTTALKRYLAGEGLPITPYISKGDSSLLEQFGKGLEKGITVTAPGFYGPQGRSVRALSWKEGFLDVLNSFKVAGLRITNFEMETAALYGLSQILGHRALSLNALIANRASGKFSQDPRAIVQRLIEHALSCL